jgi:2-polyprenyl-6-methoxyphenol hydroxylase-like FAD-dependent oxidoreductase
MSVLELVGMVPLWIAAPLTCLLLSKTGDPYFTSTNMTEELPTIVIVGAGLSGLALALGLERTNKYKIEIVERRKDLSSQGAAFGLAPNGIKALNEMFGNSGLVDDIKEAGVIFENGAYNVVLLPWWAIRDALLKRVQESKHINLHTNCEFESVIDEPEDAFATVTCSNTPLRIKGALVVGADGVNSSVRRFLGWKAATPAGAVGWRGHTSVSCNPIVKEYIENHPGVCPIMVLNKEVIATCFSFLPKSDIICWVISTKNEQLAETVADPLDSFSLLREHVEDAEVWRVLEAIRDGTESSTAAKFQLKIQDMSDEAMKEMGTGWGGRGRVVLIGDSAHALRSASGQGGNLAFEDCAVLCRILCQNHVASSLDSHTFCRDNVVSQFEASRVERVKTIHEDQTRQSKSAYTKSGRTGWTDEFIDWVYRGV